MWLTRSGAPHSNMWGESPITHAAVCRCLKRLGRSSEGVSISWDGKEKRGNGTWRLESYFIQRVLARGESQGLLWHDTIYY